MSVASGIVSAIENWLESTDQGKLARAKLIQESNNACVAEIFRQFAPKQWVEATTTTPQGHRLNYYCLGLNEIAVREGWKKQKPRPGRKSRPISPQDLLIVAGGIKPSQPASQPTQPSLLPIRPAPQPLVESQTEESLEERYKVAVRVLEGIKAAKTIFKEDIDDIEEIGKSEAVFQGLAKRARNQLFEKKFPLPS